MHIYPLMLTAQQFERACVCQALRRVTRQVSRRYERALKPVALKPSQFSVLAALNRPQPTTLGALAKTLGLDRTTLTRELTPLERRELVETLADPEDKRARLLRLTAHGRALFGDAAPLWRAAQAETKARLKGADWSQLRASLDLL